jgi:hypothetical protein
MRRHRGSEMGHDERARHQTVAIIAHQSLRLDPANPVITCVRRSLDLYAKKA